MLFRLRLIIFWIFPEFLISLLLLHSYSQHSRYAISWALISDSLTLLLITESSLHHIMISADVFASASIHTAELWFRHSPHSSNAPPASNATELSVLPCSSSARQRLLAKISRSCNWPNARMLPKSLLASQYIPQNQACIIIPLSLVMPQRRRISCAKTARSISY
jgi:hypothetical protein